MARDPRRIDPLLEELGRVWHADPEMRLGQLVYVLTHQDREPGADVFNVHDEVLYQRLLSWRQHD